MKTLHFEGYGQINGKFRDLVKSPGGTVGWPEIFMDLAICIKL